MQSKENISRRVILGGTLATLAMPRFLLGQKEKIRSEADCVFCQINSGAREAAIIYEDDVAVAFGSLYAIQPGHVLVVPRTHAQDLFDLPKVVGEHILPLAARVGGALKSLLKADGLTLLQNNGKASGQSVFHFHLHLIPRYHDQEIFQWNEDAPRTTLAQREAVLAPVRAALHPGS